MTLDVVLVNRLVRRLDADEAKAHPAEADVARLILACLCEDATIWDVLDDWDEEHRPPAPKPALAQIAARFPRIAWLAYLPASERRWYAKRSESLRGHLEEVPAPVWRILLSL